MSSRQISAAGDTARPTTNRDPGPDVPVAVTHVNGRPPTDHDRDVISAALMLQRERAAELLAGVLAARPLPQRKDYL